MNIYYYIVLFIFIILCLIMFIYNYYYKSKKTIIKFLDKKTALDLLLDNSIENIYDKVLKPTSTTLTEDEKKELLQRYSEDLVNEIERVANSSDKNEEYINFLFLEKRINCVTIANFLTQFKNSKMEIPEYLSIQNQICKNNEERFNQSQHFFPKQMNE